MFNLELNFLMKHVQPGTIQSYSCALEGMMEIKIIILSALLFAATVKCQNKINFMKELSSEVKYFFSRKSCMLFVC